MYEQRINRRPRPEPTRYCYEFKVFGNVDAIDNREAREFAIDDIIGLIQSGKANIKIIPIPE